MSPTRPTHTVTALDERHRAGVKRLVTGKLPGQWDDVDIDEALADEAAGRGLALVAETPNGVIEGFMRFEMGNAPDGSLDVTTTKLVDFVSVNQAGLPLLHSIPGRLLPLGFSQVITDTGLDMTTALESLGWTVFGPGFGLAWAVRGESAAHFSEPRTYESRPLAAHLQLNENLRVWPYRYAADRDNFASRDNRMSQWLRLTVGGTVLRSEHTRLG